ncbi:Hypothetical_protein [Hexamita inflata]|uniref:Hypothetical_protein n=1 Tax=Hexamita inflata TaxID=28002 RepID=A0AA86UBX7_9EUKA|nr:Hypothetical protein HINF_LOCUS23763 [Hexamita inflata]
MQQLIKQLITECRITQTTVARFSIRQFQVIVRMSSIYSPPFWGGVYSIRAEKTASERPKALEWGITNGGICALLLRSESNCTDSGAVDVFVELRDSEQNRGANESEPEAVSCWLLKIYSKANLNSFNDE